MRSLREKATASDFFFQMAWAAASAMGGSAAVRAESVPSFVNALFSELFQEAKFDPSGLRWFDFPPEESSLTYSVLSDMVGEVVESFG